jgi:hypothetical protein
MISAAAYIPKFESFYRHPVPGFIVTGLLTAVFVLFMVYVWATNFGPLAPSRRSEAQQPPPPDNAASDAAHDPEPGPRSDT